MMLTSSAKQATRVMCFTLLGGCIGDAVTIGGTDAVAAPGDGGTTSATTPGGPGPNARTVFETSIQPLLLGDCGSCHANAANTLAPHFLIGDPDLFTTVTSWGDELIGPTPESSLLLTKPKHLGPSYLQPELQSLSDHKPIIAAWITQYRAELASAADMAVAPRLEPFAPVAGTKTIDLTVLDARIAGATLSFDIATVGGTLLRLSNLRLTAPASTGVHIKSTLFSTYAPTDADKVVALDSDFADKDLFAAAGTTAAFNPSVTVFSWDSGQLVGVAFAVIEPSSGTTPVTSVGCKDLAAFGAFMTRLTTAQPGMANACSSGGICHGQSGGTGGLNLNGISATNAAVCKSVLDNVSVTMPAQSAVYQHVTDGSMHMGGKMAAATQPGYLADLTSFANAQK
jgi:hypothetical protein